MRGWRVTHGVHAGLCLGLVGLVGGILAARSPVVFAGLGVLAVTLLAFFIQVGAALARPRGEVRAGTRTAVVSLFLAVFLGLWMGHGYAGVPFHGNRALWIQVHLSLGILGWVGGSIAVLAGRDLPARHGVSGPAPAIVRTMGSMLQAGVVLAFSLVILDVAGALAMNPIAPSLLAAVAAAPAAVAVWGIQPSLSLRAIARRPAAPPSVQLSCWQVGYALALVTATAAVAALSFSDPRWNLLFGWSAIWGWGGFFVHGLLREEMPPLERTGAPSPQAGRSGLARALSGTPAVHAVSFVLGTIAIATGGDSLARLTGAALVLTGAGLIRVRYQAGRARTGALIGGDARYDRARGIR
jgi:hypothetical protein